ncbi:hypothetical protein Sste5344_004576 [Sporothrix stenoceras]
MTDIRPKALPRLNLPPSSATVRVKAIDSTTRMSCNAHAFVQAPIPNHTVLNLKTMCFLIEHKPNDDCLPEYVLFDAGSRKDYWNSSPQTCAMIGKNLVGMQVDYGIDEILTSTGFNLENLNSVYAYPRDAQTSVDKIKLLDAHPGVFVCMAHDHALFDTLPLYNNHPEQDINDWRERGYKDMTCWAFLNELPRDNTSGQDVMVRGLRRADNTVMEWDCDKGFIDTVQH